MWAEVIAPTRSSTIPPTQARSICWPSEGPIHVLDWWPASKSRVCKLPLLTGGERCGLSSLARVCATFDSPHRVNGSPVASGSKNR